MNETSEARSEEPPVPVVSEGSPRAHALLWFGIGIVGLGIAQLPLAWLSRPRAVASIPSASITASAVPSYAPPVASVEPVASVAIPRPVLIDPDAGPPPYRIAQLESAEVEVAHGKVGKRSCAKALEALGVSKPDVMKFASAASRARKQGLDGCHAGDLLFVAMDKVGRRLRALELETSPGDLVRVYERGLPVPTAAADAGVQPPTDPLVAEHVTLPVTHRRHATAFVITGELTASIVAAGLDGTLVDPLDEALASRGEQGLPPKGALFRVIADATYVAGRFDRYDELVALDYRPRENAPVLRLYHLRDAKSHGWFDAKGQQPLHGKWRMPIAFPRITSRFNPHRMHPVLHTVMPHNGCDFAALPGTPVYSIGAGEILFRGEAGPSGNLVTMLHDGGIESGYAHLSRFAPGIVAGTHIEAHTLVGYVGSTGRSTGPHLHLSVKKHGIFVDPLTLKMDGVRVVPPHDRATFALRREDADRALDAIPFPHLEAAPHPAVPAGSSAPAASASESPLEDLPADDHPH